MEADALSEVERPLPRASRPAPRGSERRLEHVAAARAVRYSQASCAVTTPPVSSHEPRIGLASRDRRRETSAPPRRGRPSASAPSPSAPAARSERLHRRRRQPYDGGAAEQLGPRDGRRRLLAEVERVVPRDDPISRRARAPAYAHGISADRVPRDGGCRRGGGRRAPRRGRRGRAAPSRSRVGAADAVVGDRDHGAPVGSATSTVTCDACAYFATFASASETT